MQTSTHFGSQTSGEDALIEPSRWTFRALWLPLVVVVWATLIGAGMVGLMVYHNSPGARSDGNPVWQENPLVALDTSRDNLLVFIHPKCPCSQATLSELARIQADCGDRLRIGIAVYQPDEENWSDTPVVRQALDIPKAHVFADPNGELATLFGAETSGHVMLFSTQGIRTFSGGITPGRGHEGNSLGREAIRQYVSQNEIICDTTHVYGCPIVDRPSAGLTGNEELRRELE
ncbi:hypothetical protein GC197_07715 [bacterium]|nr:hypothetical protein [bacterium]